MHIALCGAGGTGKGTLAKALSAEKNWPMISSANELIGKKLFSKAENYKEIPNQSKESFQYAILAAQMVQEEIAKKNDFISERSVVDYIPYALKAGADSPWTKNYVESIVNHLKDGAYDYLIYVPVEFKPKDQDKSKWKERDSKSQSETAKAIESLLPLVQVAAPSMHIIRVKGSVEERKQQVLNKIKQFEIH